MWPVSIDKMQIEKRNNVYTSISNLIFLWYSVCLSFHKYHNKNGIKREGGVIINISSTPAIAGYAERSPYNIAKDTNIALTKCIAREYAINNIIVYTLTHGSIATLATIELMTQEEICTAAQESSMKRWGKPEEVAKVVICIADNSFSFATGNTLVLDDCTVLLWHNTLVSYSKRNFCYQKW